MAHENLKLKLGKLKDIKEITPTELYNVEQLSVTKLPNKVTNQANRVKRAIINPVTSSEGISKYINQRFNATQNSIGEIKEQWNYVIPEFADSIIANESNISELGTNLENKKLDKVNGTSPNERAYIVDKDGNQTTLNVDIYVQPNCIVKRNNDSTITGVANLDANGLIPSTLLPSYVDDILEFDSIDDFPTGEEGKIYVDKSTNLTYRWGGSSYVEISKSLALGETSSTAYAGDKGAKNREDIEDLDYRVSALSNDLKNNYSTSKVNEKRYFRNYGTPSDPISSTNSVSFYGTEAVILTSYNELECKVDGEYGKSGITINSGNIYISSVSKTNGNYDYSYNLYTYLSPTTLILELTESGGKYSGFRTSSGITEVNGTKDVKINGTSWNDTYKKVQSLYGTYVDSYITTDFTVPTNALDYALINKLYGISVNVGNRFRHSNIKELNVPRTANVLNPNIKEYTAGAYARMELIDNGIRVYCDAAATETGKIFTSVYLDIPVESFEKGKAYKLICNIKSNSTNTPRIRLFNILADGTQSGIYDTNSLGDISGQFNSGSKFVVNSNAVFIRVNFYSNSGGISNKGDYIDYTNIFFGISDSDEYIPYLDFKWEVPLSIQSLEGYGLGISQEISNVVDLDAGTYTMKVAKVKLSDLKWSKSSNTTFDRFIASLSAEKKSFFSAPFKINNVLLTKGISVNDGPGKLFINSNTQLVCNYSEYGTTTLEEFTKFLNDNQVEIVYQLQYQQIIDIGNIDNLIEVLPDSRVVNNNDNVGRGIIEMEYQVKVGY